MTRYEQVWSSLQDEEYRREYSADVGTGLAFQIKLLREKNGWTQEHVAQLTGKQQETISQWENPNYGSYTLSSLKSLAAAFDVALLVRFAPFSELVEWNTGLTPQRLAPPSFVEENLTRRMYDKFFYPESGMTTAEPTNAFEASTTTFFVDTAADPFLGATYESVPRVPREESRPHAVAA